MFENKVELNKRELKKKKVLFYYNINAMSYMLMCIIIKRYKENVKKWNDYSSFEQVNSCVDLCDFIHRTLQ